MISGTMATVSLGQTNSENKSNVSVVNGNNFYDIVISPGKDSSQLNFNWYSNNSKGTPIVQVALKSDASGSAFPINKASTFQGQTGLGNNGAMANKVSCSGFKESTQYVYRLGDGTNWSPMYSYNTYMTSRYSFLFAGDPQIGAGGDINKDTAGWEDTINKATTLFKDNSFMISVGDQINNGKELNGQSNELEYSGYFAPKQFTSLPISAIAGNHETYGPGHITHFNCPNLSTKYGIFSGELTTGTDYYFTYGNVLYLMLNSNDMNEEDHKQFMKDAIAKNPNAKWRVAVLHHSVYSSADHETDEDIIERRNTLPPIFDSLGIDVVLDGHDHCYTRTYQMQGGQAIKNQTVDASGNIVNPKGIVYITANSASGSKYYEMRYPGVNNSYEAVKQQIHIPTFSRITVDNNSFKIVTYRTDTMAQTDSYTLVKTAQAPSSNATTPTSNAGSTNNSTTNNQVQKETAVSLNPSNAAKSVTSESNLPKTGKFIDTIILIIIGGMLIFIGSLLFIIRKKKII